MAQDAQTWDEDRPIYRQLMEQIVAESSIETYREGELLPSVRQIASDFLVNPLTVARAYRELGESRRRGAASASSSKKACASCCCAASRSGSCATSGR